MIKNFVFLFACDYPATGSIIVAHVVFQIFSPELSREATKFIRYSSVFSVSIEKRTGRIRIA